MTTTREQLKEAYRLIRRDQPEQARDILRPILEEDPDNAHAWWLLAYSVDDPHEVRDALQRVLDIDPNYTNAGKAREMLDALEAQYFSADSAASGSLFDDDDDESDSLLGGAFGAANSFGADESLESIDGTSFFDDDSLLGDYDDLGLGAADAEASDLRASLDVGDGGDDALDDLFGADALLADEEKRAEADEKAGKKGGGGRILRLMLLLVLLAVVIVGAWYVFLRDEGGSKDPGALTEVQSGAADVNAAVAEAQTRLAGSGLGAEQLALIASTSLGDALVVQFCREPSLSLPEDVNAAMRLAAQQASTLPAGVTAVGASINRCGANPYDALYRAFVSATDAQAFLSGAFGDGDAGWAAFQATWRKS